MLALLAAVENFIPPVPADTAVALGAFLSARGVLSPTGVLAVTLASNIGGAVLVYRLARGPGRRWFSTPAGQRLLSPRALSVMEREYIRLGLLGIFVVRLLPGLRAAVPPFAGLARIGAVRTFVPIALAALVWYGGITWLGLLVGQNWERIRGLVGGLNTSLGLVALLVAVGGAWWFRRRVRAHRAALWDGVASAVAAASSSEPGQSLEAIAPLVLEVACADEELGDAARDHLADRIRRRWRLSSLWSGRQFDELLAQGTRLRGEYSAAERFALAQHMLELLRQDHDLDLSERRMLERAGSLLGLEPVDIDRLLEAAGP